MYPTVAAVLQALLQLQMLMSQQSKHATLKVSTARGLFGFCNKFGRAFVIVVIVHNFLLMIYQSFFSGC